MTLKVIPAALQAHLEEDLIYDARLLRMKARDGTVHGITMLDRDIVYDDGAGEIRYKAAIGFDTVAFEKSAALDVDNSEARVLLADAGPFTSEFIEAGNLDYGEYVVYRVNWKDLSQGHEIVSSGTIGIVKNVDGVSGVIELRGLPQQLKQNYMELYSIECRAKFGSGGGGTCIQRGQCGYDAESLWQAHSVSSVGEESDRIFTADSAPEVNGPNGELSFVPGVVEWLTGDNAGLQSEVEAIDSDGTEITLRFGTSYPIQDGDNFEIRPDCDKAWATCRDDYDNQENFRGEPFIPLADERSQSVPSPTPVPEPTPPDPPEVEDPPDPPDPPPDPPDPPEVTRDIVNPGFESGTTGWAGAEWRVNGKRPRSGSLSAEFTGEELEIPWVQVDEVPVSPAELVTGRCYIASNKPGVMGGRCMLRWYDGDGLEIANDYGSTVSSSSFSQSLVSENAPGGAEFVAIGVQPQNPDFDHSIFVDDFSWNL